MMNMMQDERKSCHTGVLLVRVCTILPPEYKRVKTGVYDSAYDLIAVLLPKSRRCCVV